MQIVQNALGWVLAGCVTVPAIALFVSALLPANKNHNAGTHEQHSQ